MSALRVGRPGEPVHLIDQGPAAARFHGPGPWGTRNAVVVNSSAGYVPVVRANLRTPETTSSKAARLRREQKLCGKFLAKIGDHCARAEGHRYEHKSRYALDNAAMKKASGMEA